MRALKKIKIVFQEKTIECEALFDTGANITVIQSSFFKKNFGEKWQVLKRSIHVYWINGHSIKVNKYATLEIIIDEFTFPETVFLVDEFKQEVEVEGKRVKLPNLIIGSGTMDKYGIVLDPKEGVKVVPTLLI